MTASGNPTARRPQRDEVVDALIIGAGPSGSVAAKHLSAAGFSVITLEQGHMPDRDLYPGRRPSGSWSARSAGIPIPMSAICPATIRSRPASPTSTR